MLDDTDLAIDCGDFRAEAGKSGLRLLGPQATLLWERPALEARELYLGDDGWLVVRIPEETGATLAAISPSGLESIRVSVRLAGPDCSESITVYPFVRFYPEDAQSVWRPGTAITFFLTHEGERYFSVFPLWGQRFLLNLTRGELSSRTLESIENLEEDFVEGLLTRPHPYADLPAFLVAIALVQRRGILRLIPLLLTFWRAHKAGRPTLALILASMEKLEPGAACYSVDSLFPEPTERVSSFPQEIPDRPEQLASLHDGMDLWEILDLVGCPDYASNISGGDDLPLLEWDYYTQSPLTVTRLCVLNGEIFSLERRPFTPMEVELRLCELLAQVDGLA